MLKTQIKNKTSAVPGRSPVPVRLVIGSYNRLIGEALKRLLITEKEINIIGVFSGEKNFKEFFQLNPDVVLLDSKIFQTLPENFNSVARAKILLIGDQSLNPPSPQWLDDFISRGGAGILSPADDVSSLKEALNAVSRGEIWVDRKTVSGIRARQAKGRKGGSKLTEKEKDVAALICLGCTNKEVAQKLKISEHAVKSHCNRIYKKLEVSDRLHLVVKLARDLDTQDHLN